MNRTTTQALPILDLLALEGTATDRTAFLQQLRFAARDIGFFYLINHGISPELQQAVQDEAQQFFALPDAEKQKVAMIHSPHFRGYNRAASELTRGKPDWREQFDIGAELPALSVNETQPGWLRLQGPNLWPESLPTLKPILLQFQREMTSVALKLLRTFAQALELPTNSFDSLYGNKPNEHIKLIRYPGQQTANGNQGVGAHKDSGFLSFLLQDQQQGLQVEVTPDNWIDASPLPGSFVVNIGELLELATNGYLRATVHRVISPPPGHERQSIAFFLGAQLDAIVPVYALPPALARYALGPESDPHNPLLRDVGWNYLKGRLRSHPDVAERYYPDVLRNSTELIA
jgi:isopenicillin N synthase-like dioxygenase